MNCDDCEMDYQQVELLMNSANAADIHLYDTKTGDEIGHITDVKLIVHGGGSLYGYYIQEVVIDGKVLMNQNGQEITTEVAFEVTQLLTE